MIITVNKSIVVGQS